MTSTQGQPTAAENVRRTSAGQEMSYDRRKSSAQVLDPKQSRKFSVNFASTGVRSSFPPVTLNKTLHDFLTEELRDGEEVETHCAVKPHSEPGYGEAIPLSRKYLIHCAQSGVRDDLAHLNLEVASFLLNFFVGPMRVVYVGSYGNSDDKSLGVQSIFRNALNNTTVIEESQRPQIMCYANKDDFWVNHDGSKIRFAFAMDMAERVPNLFEPDLIYLLNSKRWLADTIGKTNGDLPAPNDLLIDTEIKCSTHHTEEGHWYNGGKGCQDCTQGIANEVGRVEKIIEDRKLPFVLKLTQSLSSVGTNIVTTEDSRSDTLTKIRRTLLDYLPRITKDNAHLYTMTLVLSDLIPGKTMALNFFVRRDGSCEFSGACNQLATGLTGRQTTAITYADQEKLQKKYQETLDKMSQLLHKAGYYGQVGVDIMEDEESGKQYVIDANVRTALSMLLYQLRGHFEQHGHAMCMVYECLFLGIPREEFEENFAEEFEEARIIILGSTKLGRKNVWGFGMILAGQNKKELDDLSDRILQLETNASAPSSD